MAKLKIITGEKNPILRAVSEPVKKFDAGLRRFAKDMKDTMIAADGLGIAAPQVGKNIRVFIVALNHKSENEAIITMVNPQIVAHSAEVEIAEEGCLSVPGKFGNVERFKGITVEFFDPGGAQQVFELYGLNARIVQHENDHINGILFVDRMKEAEGRKGLAL